MIELQQAVQRLKDDVMAVVEPWLLPVAEWLARLIDRMMRWGGVK